MAAAIYPNDEENVTSALNKDLKAFVPSCWRRNEVILIHLSFILSQKVMGSLVPVTEWDWLYLLCV